MPAATHPSPCLENLYETTHTRQRLAVEQNSTRAWQTPVCTLKAPQLDTYGCWWDQLSNVPDKKVVSKISTAQWCYTPALNPHPSINNPEWGRVAAARGDKHLPTQFFICPMVGNMNYATKSPWLTPPYVGEVSRHGASNGKIAGSRVIFHWEGNRWLVSPCFLWPAPLRCKTGRWEYGL